MKKGKKISFETIEKEYCKATNSSPYNKNSSPFTMKSVNGLRLHINAVIDWIVKNPYKYYIDHENEGLFYRASKDSILEHEKGKERLSSCTRTDPATVEYIMVI